MPHQCTNCGRTFDDGSTEMLSGCPDCGGNKFQFRPAGSTESAPPEATGGSTGDGGPDDTASGDELRPDSARTGAAHTDTDTNADAGASESPASARSQSAEDGAQASARSDVVSPDELAAAAESSDPAAAAESSDPAAAAESSDPAAAPSEERASDDRPRPSGPRSSGAETAADDGTPSEEDPADPNLDALRQKLNDQFESIRIVSPGQYELNLMELYDREEYIISLREDGRYVIEMPEGWDDR